MKSLHKLILLMVVVVFASQQTYGQRFLKNLANKAKQKVEQKMEDKAMDKIEEKMDSALAEPEGSAEENKRSDQERMQGILNKMGMSGDPVPVDDQYTFSNLIHMNIESFEKNGSKSSEGEFILHSNGDNKNIAYQVISGDMAKQGHGFFIFDFENNASILLSEENGEKKGIVYGINAFLDQMNYQEMNDDGVEETPEMYLANPNVNKTGRSKNILGYKCEEYVYKDDQTTSNIWITKDLKFDTGDFFSTLFKTSIYSRGMPWGYMMEVESENKNTGERSMMKVTDVQTNAQTKIDLGQYELMNLGSMTIPQE